MKLVLLFFVHNEKKHFEGKNLKNMILWKRARKTKRIQKSLSLLAIAKQKESEKI